MDSATTRHLTDEELVAELDGERTIGTAQVAHLENCWSCRARLNELQSAVNGFVRLRDDVLLAVPEPPPIWPGLEAGMDRIDAAGPGGSIWRRVRRGAIRSWSSRVAIAASLLLVLSFAGATPAAAARAVRDAIRFLESLVTNDKPGSPTAPLTEKPTPQPIVVHSPKTPGRSSRVVKPAPIRLTATELVELDLDVVSRLDLVGAFLGEQLAVTRDLTRGVIEIRGVVDSAARRQELVGSLGELATHRALVINLSTAAEEIAAQTTTPANPITIRSVDIDISPPRVDEELRRHIGAKLRREATTAGEVEPSDTVIRREVRTFTSNVLNRSLQARLHARAVMQAVDRYSLEDLKHLSADARRVWNRIIRQHAEAFQRETAALRQALAPIFFTPGALDTLEGATPVDGADLAELAGRLLEFGSSHDATIARTFSRSTEPTKPETTAWTPLERSLNAAERLAGRIAKLVNK